MLDVVPHIVVEVSSSHADLAVHWRDLTTRAAANVFMNPAITNLVQATAFAPLLMLTAWDRTSSIAKLVGVWALRKAAASPLGPPILFAPPYKYSFVSNPVVDRRFLNEVVPAFFDAVARDSTLPKVLRLSFMDGGHETFPAIAKALAERGSRSLVLGQRERAFASREAGLKTSGSTRKKLRQDWTRLAAEGAVAVVNDRSPAAVVAAFETFLAMEAASWKQDSAMLADARGAAFARSAIASLAAEGGASVAFLTVGGTPIAAQVLLYSGRMAYTWKTAYDERYGRFSPGALLIDRLTADLLAGGEIDTIESCSPQGGFMLQMWTGRRPTVDLLVDLGRQRSLTFALVAFEARGRARLKKLRDRLRRVSTRWSPLPFMRSLRIFDGVNIRKRQNPLHKV